MSVVGPPEQRPAVRDGRLGPSIGNVATLDEAVAALDPTHRVTGKTIIRIRP